MFWHSIGCLSTSLFSPLLVSGNSTIAPVLPSFFTIKSTEEIEGSLKQFLSGKGCDDCDTVNNWRSGGFGMGNCETEAERRS